MAQPQKTVKAKKAWYPIVSPKMFGEVFLGETIVYEAGQMKGKHIQANLMNLTNDSKRQNVNLTFEVVEVKDGKGHTAMVKFELIPSSIRRMVRRRGDRIDFSFACLTQDNIPVRIKPLLVTRGNTTSVIQRKLHHIAADFVLKQVKRLTFEQLVGDLITYKFQTELRSKLNKTYPLKACEIRSLVLARAEEKIRQIDASEVAKEPVAVAEPQQESA